MQVRVAQYAPASHTGARCAEVHLQPAFLALRPQDGAPEDPER